MVNSEVYPEKLAPRTLEYLRSTSAERDEVDRIIMSELVFGIFEHDSIKYLGNVIRNMKDRGCDAIILACTEIPVVIDDANSSLPTLGSTRLLARAALNFTAGTG